MLISVVTGCGLAAEQRYPSTIASPSMALSEPAERRLSRTLVHIRQIGG
jgi:hypothetical protein